MPNGEVRAGALLSLVGIAKSYWRGSHEVRVLGDVALDVRYGELVAVWGPRGSGKSTLLRLAARLERPDCGSVRFEGVDLADLTERQHARLMLERLVWLRRGGPRGELRMLDYVALPLLAMHSRRDAYARAAEAIARVGLSAQARQRWGSLCDGERALIGIAHGIARRPRLLLVDDPTANLDVAERERVAALLHALVHEQHIAVLMAAPDMPAAMYADRIFALGGGRLNGTPPPQLGKVVDLHGSRRTA